MGTRQAAPLQSLCSLSSPTLTFSVAVDKRSKDFVNSICIRMLLAL